MTSQTLEFLYRSAPDGDAYSLARSGAVDDLAAYLAPHLKRPAIADGLAREALASAEEMGRISGNEVHGEISGRYTISGNPLAF